jgi:hypothetical protein
MSLNSEADSALQHDWNKIAESSYNAYAISTGGKNYQGLQMPTFTELPDQIKIAWQVAVRHAVNVYNWQIKDPDALILAEAGWKGWKPDEKTEVSGDQPEPRDGDHRWVTPGG